MDRYDGKENRALRILILVFILIVLTILDIGYGLYVHSDPVTRREFTGLGVMLTGAIAAAIILSWRESRLRTYYEQVAITKALHESDTRWQFALEGAGDGLWDRNAQTNQVFYSHQWKAMLGFAAEEIGDSPDEWQKRIHPDDVAQVMTQIEQHFAGQTPVYTSEYRLRCKDGTYKWILDRGKVISWDENRKPLRVIGTNTDITSRKQLAIHWQEAQERLLEAQQLAHIGHWEWDLQKGTLLWSDEVYRIFGVTPGEFVPSVAAFESYIHPEDKESFLRQSQQMLDDKQLTLIEHRIILPDGQIRHVQERAQLKLDDTDTVMRVIGTVQDITEHRHMEEALRVSEARYRLITEYVDDVVWQLDTNLHFVYVSPATERVLGYSTQDVHRFSVTELLDETGLAQMRAGIQARLSRTADSHRPVEYKMRHKAGHWVDVEVLSSPVFSAEGDLLGFVGVTRDITGRKQAERALRESEAKYRLLAENISDVIWVLDLNTAKYRYFSPSVWLLRGYTADEAMAQTVADSLTVESGQYLAEILPGRMAEFQPDKPKVYVDEIEQICKDGSTVSTETITQYVVNAETGHLEVYGVSRNITKRKQVESALRENEERLRLSLYAAKQGLYDLNVQTGQAIVNREYAEMLGYDPDSFVETNQAWKARLHPDDHAITSQVYQDYVAGLLPEYRLEFRQQTQTGDWKWILSIGKVVEYDAAGQPLRMLGTHTDITAWKQMEESLRESENRAQAMLKAIPDLMFCLDRQGVFLDYKADIQELYAQTEVPLIGKRNRDVAPTEFADLIEQKIEATLESGGVQTFEYQLAIPGRGWRDYEARMAPSGEDEVLAIVRDITDRQLALDTLRKSEERFRSAFDNMLEGAQILDFEWRYLFLNMTAEKHNHRPNQELLGHVYMDCWPGIETTHVFTVLKRCMEERVGNHLENEFVFSDGTVRWFELSIQPIPEGVFILSVDITERKWAEAELRQSEELYRGLMESLDSVIATVDKDGRFLYMNDRAAAQLNGVPSDFIGKTMYDLFPEPVASRQLANIQRAIHEDKSVASEAQTFVQGQCRWNRTTIQPIHDEAGKVMFALVNSTDIDNLKQIQQELEELNHTLEKRIQERTAEVIDLYDHAPTGYHSVDPNGMFMMMNQTELDWLGYHRDEVLGQKSFRDLVVPSSHLLLNSIFTQFKRDGLAKDIEFEMVRKDGTILPVLLNATAIYNEQGEFVQSRSTLFDITERRKAEKALRESQASLQNFLDTASDLIQRTDQDGRYIYVNPAWCQTLGYGLEEALELTMFDVIAPQYHDRCQIILGRLPLKGQSHDFEVVFVTKTGQVVVAEGGVSIDRESNGQITTNGIFRDITLRKQAEEALRQSRDELRTANDLLEKAARLKDEFLAI